MQLLKGFKIAYNAWICQNYVIFNHDGDELINIYLCSFQIYL